jgi:hypothetical protein
VLDQVAAGAWAAMRRLLALGGPIGAGVALAASMPAQSFLLISAGLVSAGLAVASVRDALEPRARLVVSAGALRVYRPATEIAHAIPIEDIVRVELVGANETLESAATHWTLTAYTRELAYTLLHTGDRCAGLRVRTLLIERLAREGAWQDLPMSSVRCSACSARIVLPASALPSQVACAGCGRLATMQLTSPPEAAEISAAR